MNQNHQPSCHNSRSQICVFKNYGFAFSVGLMALAACLALSHLSKPWLSSLVLERELQEAVLNQDALIGSIARWLTVVGLESESQDWSESLRSIVESFSLPNQTSIEVILPTGSLLDHSRRVFTAAELESGEFKAFGGAESLTFLDIKRKEYFFGYFTEGGSGIRQVLVWRRMPSGIYLASFQSRTSINEAVSEAYTPIAATGTVASIVLGCSVFLIVTVQSRRYQRRIDETMFELAEALDANLSQNKALEKQSLKLKALLAEIQDLNRILVHDLKTPIGNIESLLTLVGEADSNDRVARERFLNLIRTSCQQAAALIDGILEIHQLEKESGEVQMKELEVNSLVEDIASNYSEAARVKNITLSLATGNSRLSLRSDEQWLGSLLGNLLSNAVKYTQQGGEIRIGTSLEGEKTLVTIQDQGPGFSEKDQSKMFHKFQKLSARPTGEESSHGLGLYAVKKLADRLGADIDFKTALGVGTTFSIRLPQL